MPKTLKSKMTFQIKRLPEKTTPAEFEREIAKLASSAELQKYRALQFRLGLAVNTVAGEKIRVGTVSCPSEKIKDEMIKQVELRRITDSPWKDVIVEDCFPSLTILYSPLDFSYPVADICLVHGLDGNAIDTFTCDLSDCEPPILWPRDLLAKCENFKAARIMTYGYNSSLFDGKDETDIRDWSGNLLRALGTLRNHDEARGIPLILLGHSLGGLVIREALASLLQYPGSHKIGVDQCGAMFLGTPHCGSPLADWNSITVALGGTLGLRQELTDYLKTFSPALLASQRVWLENQGPKAIPVVCFCESHKSKAGPLGRKMIVNQVSAGFMGQEAIRLEGTDHHNICKFRDSVDSNFGTITTELSQLINRIRKALAHLDIQNLEPRHRPLPGEPPAVSPYTPIRPLSFGVGGVSGRLNFFGREKELEELKKMLDNDHRESGEPILITGIGGIGKTELVLQVARHCIWSRDPSSGPHVIFLRAAQLDASYEALAGIIGFEILLVSQSREFLDENWKAKSSREKGEAFKFWLENSEDSKIIVIDDADTLSKNAITDLTLSWKARTLIISTRNPYLLPRSKPRRLALQEMQTGEILKAMQEGLRESLFNGDASMNSDEQLKMIGDALGNHPLGVRHAIEIMSNYFNPIKAPAEIFLRCFSGSNYRFRREFLGTCFDNQSIIDCFEVSVRRLHSDDPLLTSLLNFAGFLTSETQKNDFRYFFYELIPCNWHLLQNLSEQLIDFELLGLATTETGELRLGKYIRKLVEVSLLTVSGNQMQIHKLWIECIRQLAEETGRARYIKQIILICDTILSKSPVEQMDETKDKLMPFINVCYNILQDFSMSFDLVRSPHHQLQLSLENYMIYWRFRAGPIRLSKQVRKMRDRCRTLSTTVRTQSLQNLDLKDERLLNPRKQVIAVFQEVIQFSRDSKSTLNRDDLDTLKSVVAEMERLAFLVPDNFHFRPTLADFGERIDKLLRPA